MTIFILHIFLSACHQFSEACRMRYARESWSLRRTGPYFVEVLKVFHHRWNILCKEGILQPRGTKNDIFWALKANWDHDLAVTFAKTIKISTQVWPVAMFWHVPIDRRRGSWWTWLMKRTMIVGFFKSQTSKVWVVPKFEICSVNLFKKQ